jgi:hypothetical protein
MTDAEIAELKATVEQLKASLAPTPNDAAAVGKWKDEMHQLRERRAAACLPFSRADLAAMEAACPDHVAKAIAMRDNRAPQGPSSAGTSGQLTRVSTSPGIIGSNTGWAREIPLSPPPGVAQADRLMAAEDLEWRRQRVKEQAELRALMTAPEEKAE